jgi:hypothetical protein
MPYFFWSFFCILTQHPFPPFFGGKIGFPPLVGTGFPPLVGFPAGAAFAMIFSFR